MKASYSDKIIDLHSLDVDSSEVYREVNIDLLLGHDATIALLIDEFEKRNLNIWDVERVLFTNDHFSPPSTAERADISNKFLKFSRKQGIKFLEIDRGICHQLLVENPLCTPGALVVGADSHTIMGGGLGTCATGMGSTDILYALATGKTWMRKPKSIKIVFNGSLSPNCCGRDIVLELLRLLGEGGAQYRSLEFHDYSDPKLCQDDRFAIANMAVEMGAKFGVFIPDEITVNYCMKREQEQINGDGIHHDAQSSAARLKWEKSLIFPDPGADYEQTFELDLSQLSPRIAKPWSPANVIAIDQIPTTKITFAFLGSCSSGRIEDIKMAAEIVAGKTIHPEVRFVVIPASIGVFKQALKAGYVETLTEAGAVFNQSSCGPCGGIDKGVLGAEDVCISTSNRNFRGRMGHWDSQTYLASAKTVAKAALQGVLSDDLYK